MPDSHIPHWKTKTLISHKWCLGEYVGIYTVSVPQKSFLLWKNSTVIHCTVLNEKKVKKPTHFLISASL